MKKLAAIAILFLASMSIGGTIWHSYPLGLDFSTDSVLMPRAPEPWDSTTVRKHPRSAPRSSREQTTADTLKQNPYPYMNPGRRTLIRLAGGYKALYLQDAERYRISSIVSVQHRKKRVLISGVFPFQIVDNGEGRTSYGIDDLFLTLRVNPPGIRWSLFDFGIRFSRPIAMLFMTHENTFTTEYVGDNMDYSLGFSGFMDSNAGRFETGLSWVYSTRLTPDDDSWYDYLSPGSMFLFSGSWAKPLKSCCTLQAQATAFLRTDSKTITVLADGSETDDKVDDSQSGIFLHTSVQTDELPLCPGIHLQTCIPIENSVFSLSFLLSFRIKDI